MSAVHVKDLAFTAYPVTDMTRARGFYEGLLGLSPDLVFEQGGRHFIEYPVGSGTLALSSLANDAWHPSADGGCAALEVADFAAAVATLRQGGVTFVRGPLELPSCQMAVVRDPDGNSLLIHHRDQT